MGPTACGSTGVVVQRRPLVLWSCHDGVVVDTGRLIGLVGKTIKMSSDSLAYKDLAYNSAS